MQKRSAIQKTIQFYNINGLIRVKLEETGSSKIIIHMINLKGHFVDRITEFYMDYRVYGSMA